MVVSSSCTFKLVTSITLNRASKNNCKGVRNEGLPTLDLSLESELMIVQSSEPNRLVFRVHPFAQQKKKSGIVGGYSHSRVFNDDF